MAFVRKSNNPTFVQFFSFHNTPRYNVRFALRDTSVCTGLWEIDMYQRERERGEMLRDEIMVGGI